MFVEKSTDDLTTPPAGGHVAVGVTRIHDWFRLLRAILIIVVPVSVAGARFTASPQVGDAPRLGDFASIAVNLVVHTSFWVSLVYAYVDWRERTGEVRDMARPALSVVDGDARVSRVLSSTRRVSLGEVVGPIAIWISLTAFTFGQRRIAPLTDAGLPVPVLDPDSWPWWTPFVAWMAANATAALIATFRMGRWTPATTITSIVASLIVAGEVVRTIVLDRWVNPEYLEVMALTEPARDRLAAQITAATLVVVLGVAAWTISIAWRGWRRDRSAPPLRYH